MGLIFIGEIMDRNKNIFLTGKPGVGKTTIIKEILDKLERSAGGIFTPELIEDGNRVGFRLVEVQGSDEGILASVNQKKGPQVSKYKVNLDDLDKFSRKIEGAIEGDEEIIVIDEIGKMEMYSNKFKEVLKKAINSDKLLLATLHRSLVIRYGNKGNMFKVTEDNRDELPSEILKLINY